MEKRRRKRRKAGAAAARPVIGYVRVSTGAQGEHGHSLDAQRDAIHRWAERCGLAVEAIHSDVMSGARTDNRPVLGAAIADACRHGGILVVASLSRLARDAADLYATTKQLERCGADLASASPSEPIDTSTAVGKMTFAVLAALAEMERDFTRERTATTAAHLRRQGRRISRHLPFGYDLASDGKTLTPNPAEQRTIGLLRELRASGLPYRAIVAELASRGILAKQGGAWSPAVVADVLARAALMVAA